MQESSAGDGYLYIPTKIYDIQVRLTNEQKVGPNGFTLEILDSGGQPSGELIAKPSTQLSDSPVSGVILDADGAPGATDWSFRWLAPQASAGSLTLYFAGVDSDGGNDANDQDIPDSGSVSLGVHNVTTAPSSGCGITYSVTKEQVVLPVSYTHLTLPTN